MNIRDIATILESWAPPALAWDQDNIGLQVGSQDDPVRNVLVALDLTDAVIAEARAKKASLIVTHHPLLYRPLRSVDTKSRTGRMIAALIGHGIATYAAHTNLDFTSGGVSFLLAGRLGLVDTTALSPTPVRRMKLVTFVPRDHADAVRDAMAKAGAGTIGAYTSCSFATEGTGTFRGDATTKPFVGEAGRMEQAEEVRLEMILDEWQLPAVRAALSSAHPYEEIPVDLYRLENLDSRFGAGAIGKLPKALRYKAFLSHVRSALGTPGLRHSGDPHRPIRTVAVCGGSGSDLVSRAIAAGADAFVTADVRYHAFQEPDGRIALVDAGHFETESPAVAEIAAHLGRDPRVRAAKVRIIVSRSSKNPVQYFPS